MPLEHLQPKRRYATADAGGREKDEEDAHAMRGGVRLMVDRKVDAGHIRQTPEQLRRQQE